jgi:tRNA(fMet)-specific endonuclease VapC
MAKALLDTDILSEILKGKDAAVVASAKLYLAEHGRFTTSAVTIMEVVKGLHKLVQPARVQSFVDAIRGDEVLPLDFPSAQLAGAIYADLERAGLPIGRADPMIAGIAMHHSLVLVSGNTQHYERIAALGYSLLLENWRE